jgi:hypothetical protein
VILRLPVGYNVGKLSWLNSGWPGLGTPVRDMGMGSWAFAIWKVSQTGPNGHDKMSNKADRNGRAFNRTTPDPRYESGQGLQRECWLDRRPAFKTTSLFLDVVL